MSEDLPEIDFTVQAVENLVTQFSSALDFYRELVQNSIDAGSAAVEVWLEYIAGEEDDGTIAVHVDDGGEGMNEAIIDGQLTRLFASSKDGDLTKIGKFGIGFVSIFAPGPKAVLVHTGRGGEYWELLFHADRTFTKTRVDTPTEGTQITLFLAGDRGRYRRLVAESRETLRRWCVHSDVEISFEDRSFGRGPEVINEPFAVDGRCLTRASFEGTEVALAYGRAPVCGFYNKGLALTPDPRDRGPLGEHAARLGHVAFKVKSRWLEHTLSRETVVREGNFHKAMALVLQTAAGPLQAALVGALEELVARPTWTAAELALYFELLDYLRCEPPAELERHQGRKLLRRVDGGAVRLADVEASAEEEGCVFADDAASGHAAHLIARGVPVLLAAELREGGPEFPPASAYGPIGGLVEVYLAHRRRQGAGRVLGWLGLGRGRGVARIAPPAQVYLHVEPRVADAREAKLLADAQALLGRVGEPYGRIALCHVTGMAEPPQFVFAPKFGAYMKRPPPDAAPFGWLRPRRPEVAVHHAHPHFRALVKLSASEPAMAAYCLARALLLLEAREEGLGEALIEAAQAGGGA